MPRRALIHKVSSALLSTSSEWPRRTTVSQRKVIRANLAKLADFERLGPAAPAAEADTRATLIQQGAAQKEARVARRQSGAATTEALLGVRGSVRFFFGVSINRSLPK